MNDLKVSRKNQPHKELVMDDQREFLFNERSEEINPINLPLDFVTPLVRKNTKRSLDFNLGDEEIKRLRSLIEIENTSMFGVLLAIYNVLLSRLSNQEDIVISSGVFGFSNLLPLRNFPYSHLPFRNFLEEVQNSADACLSHRNLQLEKSNTVSGLGETNAYYLNNVAFIFQSIDKTKSEAIVACPEISEPDLILKAKEVDDRLFLSFEYATDLFKEDTVARFAAYYNAIASTIVKDIYVKLSAIEILSKSEKQQLLIEFNSTKKEYPHKTIVQLIEDQVRRTPNKIAIVFKEAKLSYQNLNQRANSLARELRKHGVNSGDIVCVMVDQSIEMVVSIIAVLKSGAAFLPIDPEYPTDRIRFMLKDSQYKLLLSKASIVMKIGDAYDFVDLQDTKVYDHAITDLDSLNAPSDLAYVIYTSGSTGQPKGTMIENKSLVNLCFWHNDFYRVQPTDNSTKYAGFGFDASVWEVFPYLIKGACIHIISDEIRLDVYKLNSYFEKNQITISFLPTQVCEQFVQLENNSLRVLLTGGDKLKTTRKTNYTVVNNYGPTENTVVTTSFVVTEAVPNIPIGKPIVNTEVYILDTLGNLSPVGVAGELCISGAGLSLGYLNRDELTKEKFVENPYKSGSRMYKTGDQARWLPDGNIEYLGRIDQQVKIRGFRIELGEIETCLMQYDEVKDAVVLAKGQEGEKYLVGYYVSQKVIDVSELINYLQKKLPLYMVPAHYVHLQSLPITANGKVDRKALPDPLITVDGDFVAPSTKVEHKLVEIWSDVLKLDKASISTAKSFFELGGHSLKAAFVVNKIRKELNVEISLKSVFNQESIRSLSEYIQVAGKSEYTSLKRAKMKPHYALSSAQQRLYYLYILDESSVAYNISNFLKIIGNLDKDKLKSAFEKLVARHESLRTSFEFVGDSPVQKINNQIKFRVEEYCVPEAEASSIISKFVRPFDLSKAPLLRAGLIELSDRKNGYVLMLDAHHIITDGISEGIMINDLKALYKGHELSELGVQYKDYSEWQNGKEQQSLQLSQKEFWLNEYSEPYTPLSLPTDFARPQVKGYAGDTLTFALTAKETEGLKQVAAEENATLFITLLSIYNIFLSKLSNQEDIVVGSPVAGRSHADLEGMMGMFVNTLALRNDTKAEFTFKEFLHDVKTKTLSSFEHQAYPYEELVKALNVQRDSGRNPLFDVAFVFQNFDNTDFTIPGLTLTSAERRHGNSKFDLTLEAREVNEQLLLLFEYSSELFKRETIERAIGYFRKIVDTVISNPGVRLSSIAIISEEEENQLLKVFNDTEASYPADKTIVDLFEDQVIKNPDAIALSDGKRELTYKELNERANQIAHLLREQNVRIDECVAVLADRSIESVIAMIGILKAGGAYLPLDKEYPSERLAYMLEDSKARIVLTQKAYSHLLNTSLTSIELESSGEAGLVSNSMTRNAPTDLAYVMYTSGSTGKPKGVAVTHRNVVRLVMNTNYVTLNEATRVLQTGAPVFDATTFEVWGSLLNGGRLFLVSKEELLDAKLLGEAIKKYKINTLWLTAALFDHHAQADPNLFGSLKYLLVGGDKLSPQFINDVREKNPNLQLINGYGPTENTTFSVCHSIQKNYALNIPIGKPISNSTAYVLDKNRNLQPIGIPGELYVGGDGVARGYLNNDALTKEKFISNPFAPEQTIYRTGDMVRWLADGTLEFLGRIDNQIKIRGFRIELGEIENQLTQYSQIKEAVVIVKEGQGDKYLVAYYRAKNEIEGAALRSYVINQMPDYMIPAHFVWLEKMPLTVNGKVDRRALPEPKITATQDYVAPSNEIESKLLEIWSNVLKLDKSQISTNKNFFELGGHSLKAAFLVNKMYKELNVEIPLQVFFKYQSIKELGAYIQSIDKSAYASIEKAEVKEQYTLAPAQQRLFYLYSLDRSSIAYNVPHVLKVSGNFDKNKFKSAFKKLIARHESLRTSFEFLEDGPVQKVHTQVAFELEECRVTEAEATSLIKKFVRPFDLSRAPLLRAGLIELSDRENEFILVFDTHHIITDGISEGIMINDLKALYRGEELAELPLQYKDYSEWLQSMEQQSLVVSHRDFWLKEYDDPCTPLYLPIDFARPLIKGFAGAKLEFSLSVDQTRTLQQIAEKESATLFIILLSAYNVLLSKLSNQEDIVVGIPVAGRGHADLGEMIGMFVNTLPVRNSASGPLTFKEFLSTVKNKALTAFDNQAYPFEELIRTLNVPRDPSRNPLFDVMFVLLNFDESRFEIPGVALEPFNRSHEISKFDLTLEAQEIEGKLFLSFEYSTELFSQKTIERFVEYFKKIVSTICTDVNTKLSSIEILSEKEKEQLLNEFNKTRVTYPQEESVLSLFEKQVERRPENLAVRIGNKTITYKELNEQSDKVASYLQKKYEIKVGDLVGVLLEREEWLLPSIFGILKAGAAYVPIDPKHPVDRIKSIIEDSRLKVLITRQEYQSASIECSARVANLDEVFNDINAQKTRQSKVRLNGGDLAYVIYTSGSTGKPKGVMIEHHSLYNIIQCLDQRYPLLENDSYLLKTTYSFDVSVAELFGWFLNGGSLTILEPGAEGDSEKIIETIEAARVTHINFVPSMFSVFAEELENGGLEKIKSLKYVFLAGEALPKELVRKFNSFKTTIALENIYGPTEGTIYSCAYSTANITNETIVPIGKPLSNISLYILDKSNTLQPLGVPGELCIGGEAVARGYLYNEQLTQEKFMVNPFVANERLYKTGDLARWLPDGTIEYLGRIDDQVKIRGFRIELGEIENQLALHEQIREAVVLAKGEGRDKNLVAYYVSATEIEVAEIKTHLMNSLPSYMVPTFYVHLENIPLTASGKVNKRALPNPEIKTGDDYVAPSTNLEEKLVEIWSGILKLDKSLISVDRSFYDCGGHSLSAATMLNKVHKAFDVKLSFQEFFIKPTIKLMAEHIEMYTWLKTDGSGTSKIEIII